MPKRRLDEITVERGIAEDLNEARALILKGVVLVDRQRLDKAGTLIDARSIVELKGGGHRYVSRGGLKLEAVLRHPKISCRDKVCLDLGASTGGFTDCLLQHGAAHVYAFDVGRGQLAWKLQQDPRVTIRDRVNVRFIERSWLPVSPDLVTIDLSFISLRLILPRLRVFPAHLLAALVKPQFEAERSEVPPGGVIRDEELRRTVLSRVGSLAKSLGFESLAEVDSPVRGPKGNQETFLILRWPGPEVSELESVM